MNRATIMIVDDNVSLGTTMAFILKRHGYNVIVCTGGHNAISKAEENPDIDLVFLDIKMPLMNGVETFKRLKEIIPNAIVTMMTAYAVEELIQESLREGASAVIYKPLDFENVLSIIQTAREQAEPALIMIVDDDISTRESFKKVLTRKGYDVITVADGDKAIQSAEGNNYDIVFIDLKLPTINGLEVFHRMKELRPDTVAVLVTGFEDEYKDIIEQALIESAYACFYKPLDMSEIIKVVKDIVKRKKKEQAE